MSNSKVIPKASATKIRAWRPDAIAQTASAQPAEATPAQTAAKLKARAAAELEQLRARAREEGQAEGYRTGIARAEGEIETVRALLNNLEATRAAIEQSAAEHVLHLALDVAKQMVRTSLAVKPESLLLVLGEAIRTFPELEQSARLVLHPDDAALVRDVVMREAESPIRAWSIIEDAAITRGGCRIQTSATDIDATVENRWRRIALALGSDHAWLDRDD